MLEPDKTESEDCQALDRLSNINECLMGLGPDYHSNVQNITRICGEVLGATCAFYNRLDRTLLCSLGTWNAPPDIRTEDPAEGHVCDDVIKRAGKDVFVIRDLPSTPYAATDPNVAKYGLKTYVGTAVRCAGQAVGSLCAVFQRDVEPGESDKLVLGILAAVLSAEENRRKAMEDLRESEKMFRLAFEQGRDPIFWADTRTGIMVNCNKAAEELLGLPRDKIIGRHLRELHSPDKKDYHEDSFRKFVQAGEGRIVDGEVLSSSGQRIPVSISATQLEIGGQILLQGLFRDMTQQAMARRSIEESERKYRALVETTGTGYVIIDHLGRVLDANQEYVRLSGHQGLGEILGRSVAEWTAPHDRERNKEAVSQCVKDGFVRNLLIDYAGRGDRVIPVEVNATCDGEGEGLRIVSLCRDVSERKRMERSLQDMQMQRLESLGTLAGGIAHDFNNMLTGVLANLSLLERGSVTGGRKRRVFQEAGAACQAAKGLARQLLTFSTGGKPVAEVRDLGALLRRTIRFSARGSSVKWGFEVRSGPHFAKVDENQLAQVVQNLVLNAVQAMPQGGTLSAEMAGVSLAADEVPSLKAGRYVRVRFRDTGPGIPEEHLDRIFDPYFSTKGPGRGLGLAVSHSILSKHGGHLAVASERGAGAAFVFYLPAASAAEKPRPRQEILAAPRKGVRVLVMDDDTMVVAALKRVLKTLGYSSVAVADGEKALNAWKAAMASRNPFAVAILDLTVAGGMGGKETVERLRAMDPDAKAIASSGYSTDPVMSDHQSHGFCGAIAKPYRIEDVSATLTQTLGGAPIGKRPSAKRGPRGLQNPK
ncbi:MAG: PAS domain S-box protein [Elusimicrobiota bacterium]